MKMKIKLIFLKTECNNRHELLYVIKCTICWSQINILPWISIWMYNTYDLYIYFFKYWIYILHPNLYVHEDVSNVFFLYLWWFVFSKFYIRFYKGRVLESLKKSFRCTYHKRLNRCLKGIRMSDNIAKLRKSFYFYYPFLSFVNLTLYVCKLKVYVVQTKIFLSKGVI